MSRSRKRRRLMDVYVFPGCRPLSAMRSNALGDPKARVITLVRRSKNSLQELRRRILFSLYDCSPSHPNNMTDKQIHYRPDIDGLRAFAILAVVLFHAQVPGFEAGFVGVDVFFAISGYLIVGIVAKEFESKGHVDWLYFFARRARRLLPEAVVVTTVTLVLGFFVLYPFDAAQSLAKSAIASTLWLSNFYFWKGEPLDYFNLFHERHPLLHTWSLGVEEQFYLVLPVVFVLLALCMKYLKWPVRQLLLCLLTAGAGVSLGLAWWAGLFHPAAGFYLLPTRAYEIAFGAIAALVSRPVLSNLASRLFLGMALALILGSLHYAERVNSWPSVWAFAPAGGASLLIWICRTEHANIIMRLLSCRPMVWLGKTSYSWYLWHFPLLVLYREYFFPGRNVLEDLAICGVALLAGALSNTYIHQWFRMRWRLQDSSRQRDILFALATASAFPILLALSLHAAVKAAEAESPSLQRLKRASADLYVEGSKCHDSGLGKVSYDETACLFGDRAATTKVYVWGDSHANQWVPALAPLFESARVVGIERWLPGCPPILDYSPRMFSRIFGRGDEKICAEFNQRVLDEIIFQSKIGVVAVVMSARWPIHFGELPLSATYQHYVFRKNVQTKEDIAADNEAKLEATVRQLEQAQIPMLVIGSVPEFLAPAPECVFRYPTMNCSESRNIQENHRQRAWSVLSQLPIKADGILLFDPFPLLCASTTCRLKIDETILFHDDNHLSVEGARLISSGLSSVVEKLIAAAYTAKVPAKGSGDFLVGGHRELKIGGAAGDK